MTELEDAQEKLIKGLKEEIKLRKEYTDALEETLREEGFNI